MDYLAAMRVSIGLSVRPSVRHLSVQYWGVQILKDDYQLMDYLAAMRVSIGNESVCLSVCLSALLSVYFSVFLSVLLSVQYWGVKILKDNYQLIDYIGARLMHVGDSSIYLN